MNFETVSPRWRDGYCIVAATGPSLTKKIAKKCKGRNVIAVNDAYRIMPFAPVMYACDAAWWDTHNGCPNFRGERWTSHETRHNDKTKIADKYHLKVIHGRAKEGFSYDPTVIHYGNTSGFQAINLAILFGCTRIYLVGFDMRTTTPRHFFGDHPSNLKNGAKYEYFIPAFNQAARSMRAGIQIINCYLDSGLTCFPKMPFNEALEREDVESRVA